VNLSFRGLTSLVNINIEVVVLQACSMRVKAAVNLPKWDQQEMSNSVDLDHPLETLYARDINTPSSIRMASPDLSVRLARTWRLLARPSICNRCLHSRRELATTVNPPSDVDLEASSFEIPAPKPGEIEFDPLASSRGRKRQLPRSRCVRSTDLSKQI
jgi:hypothetical protein